MHVVPHLNDIWREGVFHSRNANQCSGTEGVDCVKEAPLEGEVMRKGQLVRLQVGARCTYKPLGVHEQTMLPRLH